MKNILKRKLAAGILILVLVCLGIVLAGDVIVREGIMEAEIFKTIGCTATGLNAVALGYETDASAPCGTAMGYQTTAGGDISTAMGYGTEATGPFSTAMGYYTTAIEDSSTAMGDSTTASGFRSTAMGYSTTASGTGSIAMGYSTEASGGASTAMGDNTEASGEYSTAMGSMTTASGDESLAAGFLVIAGPASRTTAIGKNFTNNVQDSFAVGFDQMDFRVESGKVTVGDRDANEGILVVGNYVDANDYLTHSSFYDKDVYGTALDFSEDSSNTIKINAAGQKEYDHEADPEFLQRWVTVKDYDKYTEEEVWDDALQRNITNRIYQTHQELRSNLSMKVAWLRQCVYELKQENQTLKNEIAEIKAAVGID